MNKSKSSLWNPAFLTIFVINFVLQMGQAMSNLLIPLYTDSLGGSVFIVGLVSGMFGFTALLIRPVTGPAMQCLNKKYLMLGTCLVIVSAFLLFSVSNSVGLLIFARLFQGIGISCTGPLCLAIVVACLPEEKMTLGVSVYTAGQAVATAAGPSIGLSLMQKIGYSATFLICGLVVAVSAFLCLLLPNICSNQKFRISLQNTFTKKVFGTSAIISIIMIAYSAYTAYVAIYGGLRGIARVDIFFVVYAVVLVGSRPLANYAVARFGNIRVIVTSFVLFMLSFIVTSLTKTMPMLVLAGVLTGVGQGTVFPMMQSLGMQQVNEDERDVAANTLFTGVDLGMMLGGPVCGVVCTTALNITGDEVASYSILYATMVIPVMICLLLFLLGRGKSKSQKKLHDVGSA